MSNLEIAALIQALAITGSNSKFESYTTIRQAELKIRELIKLIKLE